MKNLVEKMATGTKLAKKKVLDCTKLMKDTFTKDNLKYAFNKDLIDEYAKYGFNSDINAKPSSMQDQRSRLGWAAGFGALGIAASAYSIVDAIMRYSSGVAHLGGFEYPVAVVYVGAGLCGIAGVTLAYKACEKLYKTSENYPKIHNSLVNKHLEFIDKRKEILASTTKDLDAKIDVAKNHLDEKVNLKIKKLEEKRKKIEQELV